MYNNQLKNEYFVGFKVIKHLTHSTISFLIITFVQSLVMILFPEIVFGPIKSRRFGKSLGVNLLPAEAKFCSFDCVYCECGLNMQTSGKKKVLPTLDEVQVAMEKKFSELAENGVIPDSITFAGNGEPTLHPEFAGIIEETIHLRNAYLPESEITVLTNGTQVKKAEVAQALSLIENNVLKLDAGTNKLFHLINRPVSTLRLEEVIDYYSRFEGTSIIQTMFLRGKVNDDVIDNTTETEVALWLDHIRKIKPEWVMIYGIDRIPPFSTLEKVEKATMQKIATQVENAGFKADTYC